tara:strand:- start:186 stop:368 length:183 start_codon:yes stop_codon:yes gene_type:complete
MKETIKGAIEDALDEDPNKFSEKIHDVLAAKMHDALKTKKMEVSNKWLNDIETTSEEEDE